MTNDQVLLDREVFEEREIASRLSELIDELDGDADIFDRNRAELSRYLASKALVEVPSADRRGIYSVHTHTKADRIALLASSGISSYSRSARSKLET